MSAPDNPFASVQTSQPQQADNGNPFASVETTATQTEQPGFWSRAYEASPLPGAIDAAKSAVSDFINSPVQGEQTFHAMIDSLKAGDFRGATSHAAQSLRSSENPFS